MEYPVNIWMIGKYLGGKGILKNDGNKINSSFASCPLNLVKKLIDSLN
jgi:hypothetical protein